MQTPKDFIWFPIFALLGFAEAGLARLQGGGSLWWLTPILILYIGLMGMIAYRIITKPKEAINE